MTRDTTVVLGAIATAFLIQAGLTLGVYDRLSARIDELDNRLSTRIDELDNRLNARIDELENRLSARIDKKDASLISSKLLNLLVLPE